MYNDVNLVTIQYQMVFTYSNNITLRTLSI
ncbi:uncharacterized protein METZ01_LOCUS215878 [marine metagenome]|uniref:Uncharacterized protein n=1 Tax=marine metagenome TaxID=408172 RepID=A0A382FKY9_9ZZZZ